MKARTRKKRKQRAYVEGLERGNQYLKDSMVRLDALHNKQIKYLRTKLHLTEMLLYATVVQAGGSVEIKTKGLGEMLDGKEIKHRADAEKHMVYIEVKDKEE